MDSKTWLAGFRGAIHAWHLAQNETGLTVAHDSIDVVSMGLCGYHITFYKYFTILSHYSLSDGFSVVLCQVLLTRPVINHENH